MMNQPLLPSRFLFRFSVPCLYRKKLWTNQGAALEEAYRLVSFEEMDARRDGLDFRCAWNEEGMVLALHVEGKRQPPWCRASRPEDSDGVQVWIDTRDVHNVHRATRFCHRFLFMPTGAGPRVDQPIVQWLPIHRARAQPSAIPVDSLKVHSEVTGSGYLLEAAIPKAALTGFDVREHPRLGFNYALRDRDLGERTFTVGSPMPYRDDPSLWATLELAK